MSSAVPGPRELIVRSGPSQFDGKAVATIYNEIIFFSTLGYLVCSFSTDQEL